MVVNSAKKKIYGEKLPPAKASPLPTMIPAIDKGKVLNRAASNQMVDLFFIDSLIKLIRPT